MTTAERIIKLGSGDTFAEFAAKMNNVSPGNLRTMWIARPSDLLTSISIGPDKRVWTYNATIAGRTSKLGDGVLVTFNGSSETVTSPDTANMSLGDGSTDSAWSVAAIGNITNTAGYRDFVNKPLEWGLSVDSSDKLYMYLRDDSAGVYSERHVSVASTQGSVHLFGCSYDGGGGATAANGIVMYEDAVVKASSATNNAAYVASENLTGTPTMGGTNFFAGSIGFVAVYAANLTTSQHVSIKIACNAYFRTSL